MKIGPEPPTEDLARLQGPRLTIIPVVSERLAAHHISSYLLRVSPVLSIGLLLP